LTAPWSIAVASAAILLYNGGFVGRIGRLSPFIARRSALVNKFGWTAVNDVARLTIAAVAQLIFLLLLVAITRIDPLASLRLRPAAIAAGALLGVAEMGLTSFAAHVVMRTLTAFAPGRAPGTSDDWLALARGGWMRYFTHAVRITPPWYLLSVTLLYVAVEEVIFRALLVGYLAPHGHALALAYSVLAFTTVQVLHTPDWKTGMFPALGAIIVGTIHGWLFLVTGDITPLIVAHFTFFVAAVV
jgi:hypothetical protein